MNDTAFVISPQQHSREASVHRRVPDGSLKPQPNEQQTARQAFSGEGGIYSTGRDYLTFIRMLMQSGALDGVRILRPDTVALMGQNQIGEIEAGVLRTTVPALSNDVDFFPGISLKWSFGHMINMQAVPDGRSAVNQAKADLHGKVARQSAPSTIVNRTVPRRAPNSELRPREYLTQKEIERLQETALKRSRYGHRDATMILVAYRHGLRASEVCGLRWDQIDLNSGRLHVRRAKGGIDNVHPLSGKEIRALRQLRRESMVAALTTLPAGADAHTASL